MILLNGLDSRKPVHASGRATGSRLQVLPTPRPERFVAAPAREAIGSSTRVLMFLLGHKDGLVRALLERARAEELALLAGLRQPGQPVGPATTAQGVWAWLAADERRPLLRLWAEVYARCLVDPDGPWAGFARSTPRERGPRPFEGSCGDGAYVSVASGIVAASSE